MKIELQTEGGTKIELKDVNSQIVELVIKATDNDVPTQTFELAKEDLLSAVKAICRK